MLREPPIWYTLNLANRTSGRPHCIGGWVGPRAGLDGCGKSRPHRNLIPGLSSPKQVAIPTELFRPPGIVSYRIVYFHIDWTALFENRICLPLHFLVGSACLCLMQYGSLKLSSQRTQAAVRCLSAQSDFATCQSNALACQ